MEVIPVHFYNVFDNLKIGSEAMHRAIRPTWRLCQTIILATIIVVTLGGCNETPGEDYIFFEPADHYDVVNVNEGIDLLWTFTPDEQIKNPVVLDGERAVYFHTPKAVYSVNPADGSLRWRHPVKNPLLDSTEVFIVPYDNLVLIPTETERVLQGVDASTGEVLWTLTFSDHISANAGRPQLVGISTDDEHAYIVLALHRGTAVLAVDPLSGDVLWKASDDMRNGLAGYIFQDRDDPFLYITSGGATWKLDKADGHIIDKIEKPWRSTRKPTYAEGIAYTSGGRARAVDLETGRILWSFSPDACESEDRRTVFEPPILVDDVAYLLTACEYVAQVDLESGMQQWLVEIPPRPKSFQPVKTGGYALTAIGDLFHVGKRDGARELMLSLSPPEIDLTTHRHLVSDGNILILTPGNNQAFAFKIK